MYRQRDEDREFSAEVKRREKINANYCCRICGIHKVLESLQSAHIYTLSLNPNWERAGSNSKKWHNDEYVSSYENCLLLCIPHHRKIDSEEGLKKCTVEYLESLKSDLVHCTALVEDKKGTWRRCRNHNGRDNPMTKGTGYRCYLHVNGGKEETLSPDNKPNTTNTNNANNTTNKPKNKDKDKNKKKDRKSSCIIC